MTSDLFLAACVVLPPSDGSVQQLSVLRRFFLSVTLLVAQRHIFGIILKTVASPVSGKAVVSSTNQKQTTTKTKTAGKVTARKFIVLSNKMVSLIYVVNGTVSACMFTHMQGQQSLLGIIEI